MPIIRNSNGEEFEVSDVDAVKMHAADPSLQVIGDVAVSPDEAGQAPVLVSAGQATTQEGVTPATAGEKGAYQFHKYLDSKTSALGAAARGAVRGLPVLGTVAEMAMDREQVEADDTIHPGFVLGGKLAGAIAGGELAGVGTIAETVGEAVGGGMLGAAAGEAAVGTFYGADNAVHELALSNSPLTAEHVSSVLGSNLLLGGAVGGGIGAGTKLLGRGMQLAGEKLEAVTGARSAVDSLPAELRGLDDAGLKEAYSAAKLEHAADIKAERASLDELRVNQKAEMANRVRDLHESLATDRPIFSALSRGEDLEPALKGIDGVSDARVQLAKSFKSMRSALDSPLSVQRDPSSLIRPLEQRQVALESLQQKMPELQAALAGDSRQAVLEHVDTALAETKQQIATIRSLKETPVASGRLTVLETGPSAKMQAIDAAREALKKAPEMGLAAKGASSAAFAGVTALAHAIPGVGIAAPFVGKAASEAVQKLFSRAAGAVGKIEGKAASAAQKFLSEAKSLPAHETPTATKVLSAVRFGVNKAATEEGLAGLFRQRTSELYQQTMRLPDGTTVMRPEARAAMAAKLDPIRHVNPLLADKIETVQARKAAYLASVAPKKPDPPALQIGPDTSRPSDMAMRAWARAVRGAEDPDGVEERLARGQISPEEAQAYRAVYPERFAELQREIFAGAPELEKTLSMQKKVALSIFTGIPVTPAMQPNVIAVLQSTFDVEPGSEGGTKAPRPQPNFGALGSLKDMDKPTRAQARQER